jgi:phosphohistidine swiveling domain-containing protein
MKQIHLILIGLFCCLGIWGVTPVFGIDAGRFPSWVETMKNLPRGPFVRLRWFCNDGTLLEPVAYACQDHGGGVQHGEWSEEVKIMRDQGYYIANIYADVVPDIFIKNPVYPDILKQMILEQFLINADDGWIFRHARYYRGALQAEDEARGGEGLLLALLSAHREVEERFLLLREAARLLPHYNEKAPISQMRQLALTIATADENFETLRIKLHVRPEAKDAARVRGYAESNGRPELKDACEHLAETIDAVFRPKDLASRLLAVSEQVRSPELSEQCRQGADRLAIETAPFIRFEVAARLISSLRTYFTRAGNPAAMLALLDTGILLEDELFRLTTRLADRLQKASLGRSLAWLEQCTDILYGTGLISARQHKALKIRLTRQLEPGQNFFHYQADLAYAARASEWAERNFKFHFFRTMEHLQTIDPLCRHYIHDRLHASLLLGYSRVLDRLITDNSRQLGIANELWGRSLAFGINGLNPGLARGILREPGPGEDLQKFPRDSILVLPATTADLPPVAGIVTAGRGNILSHVQLLARNLGIPNVAVDRVLLPEIRSRKNRKVVLAVSPGGVVQLTEDDSSWNQIFDQKTRDKRPVVKVDTEKLDLDRTGFITLQEIRAGDSGRIAGPKAANLGELKYHFPEAVTDGVVIPFGFFKKLLDQPLEPVGPTMFSWMKRQYRMIRALKEKPFEQKILIEAVLKRIRSRILEIDPGEHFRRDLKHTLEKKLGPDGSYGVFVRSDTNVEDLPGFTGAGLNLTVPNVVGFDNILAAVQRVWASPFTLRAFSWRQAYLENPEHVYVSVLLMKTVPVEKSGVMVTKDLYTGQAGWLTIAVNEGVGGAVSGQTAEELRVHARTGEVILLSQATEPLKRVVLEGGGMAGVDAGGRDAVLSPEEIAQLIVFAKQLPDRFPTLRDEMSRPVSADVEFGFYKDKLVLFQIRPFLEDFQSQHDRYLNRMDRQFEGRKKERVDLNRIPGQEGP